MDGTWDNGETRYVPSGSRSPQATWVRALQGAPHLATLPRCSPQANVVSRHETPCESAGASVVEGEGQWQRNVRVNTPILGFGTTNSGSAAQCARRPRHAHALPLGP
eukprot:7037914-Prymnesium_polylepis.1